MAVKIVELNSVSPSQGTAVEQSLPLLYFDIVWFQFPPADSLHFYNLPCSQSYFLDTIVKHLKLSLSTALKHFLPLASKIIFPLASSDAMPVSRYDAISHGDSVALTIAISDADFADMTANHPKDADEFHHLVPQLAPADYSSSDEIKYSAVAIQVTLFPNQGICFGFTTHHAICDGTTLLDFVRTWAAVHKSKGGGDRCLDRNLLPSYDRSSVQDADRLNIFIWNQIKNRTPTVSLSLPLPLPHKLLRATFCLSDAEIQKLKSFATAKNPAIGRVSTFVVVSAHLWSCLAKSAAAAGEIINDEEPEFLTSAINCRARLDPPLPENYFGNCLMLLVAASSHGRVKGNDGFVAAVEAVGAAIDKIVKNKRAASDYFENRSQIISGLVGKRVVRIAGSSRFDQYGADYGLGRAIKYECIHTDFEGGVSLCKGRDGGGVEIGLSLPMAKMTSFHAIFNNYSMYSYINSNL